MAFVKKVNVEITSDIVCPWCWVGKRHLDMALERLNKEEDGPRYEYNIRWRPFQLNPSIPEEGIRFEEYAIQKFGVESFKRFVNGEMPFVEQGKKVGLTFNYSEDKKVVSTRKGHILLEYARNHSKQHQFQERLFEAYFAECRDISNNTVLGELLNDCSLNVEEGLACLTSEEYDEAYHKEIQVARGKGISGVPFFEITADGLNVTQQFSGAQPIETMIALIKKITMAATAKV